MQLDLLWSEPSVGGAQVLGEGVDDVTIADSVNVV